jgi:hypothetical protein
VWSLETADVNLLFAKLSEVGRPLSEFLGIKPFYGIKTVHSLKNLEET